MQAGVDRLDRADRIASAVAAITAVAIAPVAIAAVVRRLKQIGPLIGECGQLGVAQRRGLGLPLKDFARPCTGKLVFPVAVADH